MLRELSDDRPSQVDSRASAAKRSETNDCDGRVKSAEAQERMVFHNIESCIMPRQLSKVVLGCVTDWQQETRGLFRVESFMVTDPASGIRHEVQQLIQLQIDTLRLKSSLTSSQLWEYHSRFQRITALYRELDQIRRDRIKYELKTAS
jgi:hypothetical protein